MGNDIDWQLKHDPHYGYEVMLRHHAAQLLLTPAGGWRMTGWPTEAAAREGAATLLRQLADRIAEGAQESNAQEEGR